MILFGLNQTTGQCKVIKNLEQHKMVKKCCYWFIEKETFPSEHPKRIVSKNTRDMTVLWKKICHTQLEIFICSDPEPQSYDVPFAFAYDTLLRNCKT